MFALRYWLGQLRRPTLQLLLMALILSVASMSSVGIFSARLESALLRDASQMLGGDVVVQTKRPLDKTDWWPQVAKQFGSTVQFAESVSFPSVVPSAQTDLLVALKAVGERYPLRGSLLVRGANGLQETVTHGPAAGEAWVDEGVLGSLGLQLGDSLTLGSYSLRLTRVLLIEPDRGVGFANFAPRVMFNQADLAATQLLGPGARATWRLYAAADASTIANLKSHLKTRLPVSDTLETLEGGRPEVSGTLERARDFLSLAALMGTLVACVGIALVAHLHARQQSSEWAVLKSMGFAPSRLRLLWVQGMFALAFAGGLLGLILGFGAHFALVELLGRLLGVTLPWAGWSVVPVGFAMAFLLLLGFAGWPTFQSLRISPMAVIRDQASARTPFWVRIAPLVLGGLTALVLATSVVSNEQLAVLVVFGLLILAAVLATLLWVGLKIAAKLEHLGFAPNRPLSVGRVPVFKHLQKRQRLLIIQGVGLSLGLSALFILAVVQGDLIDRWQAVVPKDAPNRFVFNIQPEQVEPLAATLGKTLDQTAALYPMVRGRLVGIGETIIEADTFQNADAKRMVEREFNLSFATDLPKGNQVIEGQWFAADALEPQASIESSVAERLKIRLGDELSFDVAGQIVRAKVTSIRKLRWDSMNVNFYVIFPPATLANQPQTWITAFHAPDSVALELSRTLLRQYPNLTVLDTGLVIQQLRKILGQVSQAVQFVFGFTVIAGGLVIAACVLTGAQQRSREAAIQRAMGASAAQLQRAAFLELCYVGALSGLMAGLAAQSIGWALARFVFLFDYRLNGMMVLLAILMGVLLALAFGAWNVRKVCTAPVMQTLRATQ